jgi:hypothetical protein
VQDDILTVLSRLANFPGGGDRFTASPAVGPHRSGSPSASARPRKLRASGPERADDDDMDAYVKAVVDTLPPLTDQQRDVLALIFRHR